jgi:hypothetical protein
VVEATRFRGFLGCLWLPNHGGLYRFATYTGAVVERLVVQRNQSRVSLALRSAQYRLTVLAGGKREAAVTLHGPTPGGRFEPFVREMLDAEVEVRLERRSDAAVLFRGRGMAGGLEIESMEPGGMRHLEVGTTDK